MMRFFIFFIAVLSLAQPVWAEKGAAKYDKPYIGDMIEYEARYEDTFVYLARDYNLGYVEMRAANPGIDPWIPGKGTEILLPTRHILPDASREGIVINLPEMRLYAFLEDHDEPITYPLGIGREGLETPIGETKIVGKRPDPVWRPTARMRKEDPKLPEKIEAGPENPLGTHALYLGWPQYAIHGTNRPFGIGRRVSSGCIRLYPEAIKKFYKDVPVGTKVTVVDQPVKLAWIDDVLYLEAHPDMDQAIEMEETGMVAEHQMEDRDLRQILKIAGDDQDRIDWGVVKQAINERKGYPIRIAKRPRTGDEEKKPDAEVKDAKVQEIKENLKGDAKVASSEERQVKRMVLNP